MVASSLPNTDRRAILKVKTLNESLLSSAYLTRPVKVRRTIRFNNVLEVRVYPLILGDNPAVTRGPPLSMGWEPIRRMHIPEPEYVWTSGGICNPGGRVPTRVRRAWLVQAGFSIQEIRQAEATTARIRQQREASIHPWWVLLAKKYKRRCRRKRAIAQRRRQHRLANKASLSHEEVGRTSSNRPRYAFRGMLWSRIHVAG